MERHLTELTQEPHAVRDAAADSARDGGAMRGRCVSIRLIVTAATVALVAAAVLAVGSVGEQHAQVTLARETEARILMTARNLARLSSSALLSPAPELVLHPAVREIQVDHPELAFVVVVDHEDRIRGHAEARSIGQLFHLAPDLSPAPTQHKLAPGESLLISQQALVSCVRVLTTSGNTIGKVFVGLHRSHFDAEVTASRRQQVVVVFVLLVLAVGGALLLMSVLLRPIDKLRAGLERIGRGDLTTPIVLHSRTEFQLLAESINHMASELRAAQTQTVEKERLKHEMELARQIQASLMPVSNLVAGDFEVVGVHHAAAEVGGDFFDAVKLSDGRLGIAIADVSGKGLAGCMVMSMVAVLLRSLRRAAATPSELLVALDEQLRGNLRPGVFVTMFYGILDTRSGRLRYASAGHSPLLVHRAATNDTEWHYTEGIPIGAVRARALGATLHDREISLEPGDTMVQFTDGVNEALEPHADEQFGFQRLESAVRDAAPHGGGAVIEHLRTSLAAWTGDLPRLDDETVLVVHRLQRAPQAIAATYSNGDSAAGLSDDAVARIWGMRRSDQWLSVKDPAELDQLRDWLRRCLHLRDLPVADAVLLEHALHEQCSNIIEHGRGLDGQSSIDLWWIPDGDIWSEVDGRAPQLLDDDLPLLQRIRRGVILIRDHGAPYSPTTCADNDLDDPHVRKRGRGLGLRIIQDVMNPLLYERGGAHGNLTLMRFDPRHCSDTEVRHATARRKT